MHAVGEAKKLARMRFRQVRKDLGAEARTRIDAQVADRVRSLPEWRQAKALLTYLSFGAEVDTRELICVAWDEGKLAAIPRCVPGTREMRWYVIRSFDGLIRSPLGMEEPAADPACELDPALYEQALALVPALAFDEHGYRLGYGGGFYDTFLERFLGTSVGLAREAQMVDDLRALGLVDVYDRPVSLVVSENRTLWI